jgi:hypothetical protein
MSDDEVICITLPPDYEPVRVEDMTLEQAREAIRILGRELKAWQRLAGICQRTPRRRFR